MGFYDVVVLHEDAYEESKGGKDRGTFTISRTLLAKSDTPNPSFVAIGSSTATWPGLGGQAVDKLNDLRSFDGVLARCASRKFSWYSGTESGVKIELKYEGLSDYENQDGGGSSQPNTQNSETWRRVSISTSQITVPATDKDNRTFCNSAGDPVSGLEEETAIAVWKYTNDFTENPNLAGFWGYINKCNDAPYLGAAKYTLRVTGFSAEFDEGTMRWKTSIELTYNPKTWGIKYYDCGLHKIKGEGFPVVTFTRERIKDKFGDPVTEPVPLDGNGDEAEIAEPVVEVDGDFKFYLSSAEPAELLAQPYEKIDFSNMLFALGML